MNPDAQTLLSELRGYTADNLLSEIQVDVLEAKLRGATYEQILEKFALSGPVVLAHCLRRTAMVLFWVPGMKTGPDPYLGPADERRFSSLIVDACDDVNCVTTATALALATDLQRSRIRSAMRLLLLAGCDRLAGTLGLPGPPCRSWLHGVCERQGIRICRGEELEAARRIYCDADSITEWFVRFSLLFERDVRLMFNMDETQLNAKKRMKVLCPCERKPLVSSQGILPHMTAAVTISGGGYRVKPLVILPNKKTLKGLEDFTESVYLASSQTGWMTRNLYRFYALTFVAELSIIRLRLPESLREEPVLLFVDGHSSRWDFRANLLFWLFNVDVLSFPGHTSHLLQMFDICVASPLKTEFKQQMVSGFAADHNASSEHQEHVTFSGTQRLQLKELRSTMIQSFITSYEKSCTSANCRRGFAAAGISPLCPERVLSSPYAMEPPDHRVFPRRSSKTNSSWLTSEENLRAMFRDEFGREMTPQDLEIEISEIYKSICEATIQEGIPLCRPTEPIVQVGSGRLYQKVKV